MVVPRRGKLINNLLIRERRGKVQVLVPLARSDNRHVTYFRLLEEFYYKNNAFLFAKAYPFCLTVLGRKRKGL